MKFLFEKLEPLGFDEKYVRRYGLPDWWDDELNDKPIAVLEGALYIAKRFRIDLKSLLEKDTLAHFKPLGDPPSSLEA